MNDINNDSSIDLEAKLDTKLAKKIANAKNRRDKRNGDIYKRFLKRVQHPESHKKLEPLNSARHLPTYEPLTDEELQWFAGQDKHDTQPTKLPKEATAAAPDTERDNGTLDFTLDFSEPDSSTSHSVSTPEGELDSDKGAGSVFSADIVEVDSGAAPAHHIDGYEPQDRQAAASTEVEDSIYQSTDSQSIHPQDEQAPASKRKPSTLIIGIGSVLLAAAVLGYAAITYFSNDTKDNPTQSTEATTPDNDDAAATGTVAVATQQEQDAMTDTNATADHTASSDSDAALSSDESDAIATTEQPADESQSNAASTSEDKDLDTELDAEPVITYEEFKDESQTTLYRETND
ncbi:hypothetical protein ACTXMH_00140 [Psychrobacter celer]|uniref:hypothetical protein n=1 Tax=Psychrobacter celer TaxID=306572 RepID=UPI003FD6982F